MKRNEAGKRTAYRPEFRRQYDQDREPLPAPAETHTEKGRLVMTIEGVRYIGVDDKKRGFFWVPENGEG